MSLYFSTSLQDFWDKRWKNIKILVSNVLLRHAIYKLTCTSAFENVLFRQEKQKWTHFPAVSAAFIVSRGLMHERVAIVLRHPCGSHVGTDELMCFFLIHGVCLVVEFLGEKKCVMSWVSGRWLHWAVARPLTIGFVVVTASWLFFSPLVRNGVDVKVIVKFLKGKVLWTEKFIINGIF